MTEPSRLSVQGALDGSLDISDIRMTSEALVRQSSVAQEHGNPQLAANFLLASELTTMSDEEVLDLYEVLRPHRATREELDSFATDLQTRGAERCATLVREAAGVYAKRGLVR
ncbi:diol dehydratase small subunit [Nocardioides zhouii]|uniref:Propanediol utilization protein n=1 Tax=Nocardioides zhouii TaxID=1168729 RepID=A0A4Q2SSF5_9ACTN|nr:diol dehydratase small subunit [Nocardioides zhouii]RYC07270.1 propanediol utilization protein [Nocardioides zhouii]